MSVYTSTATNYDETELQRHLRSTPSGRCLACGEPEPCRQRLEIGWQLAVLGRLPRRQPGILGALIFGPARVTGPSLGRSCGTG